jgi:hypothetical protein
MLNEQDRLHNYVFSREMVEFVTSANGYCQFLEELKKLDGRGFIEQSVVHLSGVYASFLKMGETDPVFESAGEPAVTEQDWSNIYQRIAHLLGSYNDFLRPADEGEFDRSDLVTHTISEDMADLYQELRDFTTIYSRGLEELMNDAAWELTERFAEHWGKKLLRSLIALHDLFVQGIDPEEKE